MLTDSSVVFILFCIFKFISFNSSILACRILSKAIHFQCWVFVNYVFFDIHVLLPCYIYRCILIFHLKSLTFYLETFRMTLICMFIFSSAFILVNFLLHYMNFDYCCLHFNSCNNFY